MAIKLHLINARDRQAVIAVDKTPFIVGHSRACDLYVKDDRVSSSHACIIHHNGRYYVVDLESLNGTYVLRMEDGKQDVRPLSVTKAHSPAEILVGALSSDSELRDGTCVAFAGAIFLCSLNETQVNGLETGDGKAAHPSSRQTPLELKVIKGPETGRLITVTNVPIVLGRSHSKAHVVFEKVSFVGRTQARITRDASGNYYIADIDSKNGTKLNGKIISNIPVPLAHGDILSLADEVDLTVCKGGKSPSHVNTRMILAITSVGIVFGVIMVILLQSKHHPGESPQPATNTPAPLILSNEPPAIPPLPATNASPLSVNTDQVERLFEEALAAVKQSNYELAILKIREKNNLDRAGSNEAHLQTLEGLGKLQVYLAQTGNQTTAQAEHIRRLAAELYKATTPTDAFFASCRQSLLTAADTPAKRIMDAAKRAREAGNVLQALQHLHQGIFMLPFCDKLQEDVTALRREAEPILLEKIKEAYVLENNPDPASREKAHALYREVLQTCSTNDWTAEYFQKIEARFIR